MHVQALCPEVHPNMGVCVYVCVCASDPSNKLSDVDPDFLLTVSFDSRASGRARAAPGTTHTTHTLISTHNALQILQHPFYPKLFRSLIRTRSTAISLHRRLQAALRKARGARPLASISSISSLRTVFLESRLTLFASGVDRKRPFVTLTNHGLRCPDIHALFNRGEMGLRHPRSSSQIGASSLWLTLGTGCPRTSVRAKLQLTTYPVFQPLQWDLGMASGLCIAK